MTKKNTKKDFIIWLSSRNESKQTIDEHVKKIERVGDYYSDYSGVKFNIWTILDPKKLDSVINSLTKKRFKSQNSDAEISKNSIQLLKKYLLDLKNINDKSHIDWRTQSVADNEIDYKRKLDGVTEYLLHKYSNKPAASLAQLSTENKDLISFSYMNIWTRAVIGVSAGQYLVEIGVIVPNDNVQRPAEERLSEIVAILKDRYKTNPAESYTQVVKENRDLPISQIHQWSRRVYDMTATEYLVKERIVIDKSNTKTRKTSIKFKKQTNKIDLNSKKDSFVIGRVLTMDEKVFLNSRLNSGFCLLEDLRYEYSLRFPQSDPVIKVTDSTLRSISYRVYSDFVIRDKYRSAKEYFVQKLLDNDVTDLSKWDQRVADAQAVRQAIDDLTYEFDLLEFDKKKYMTLERLTSVMPKFKRNDFYVFLSKVSDYAGQEEFFSIKSLIEKGFKSELLDLGFSEWFPASIIKNSRDYKYIHAGDIFLFYTGKRTKTKVDFFKFLMLELSSIELDDFVDLLRNDYGMILTRNRVIRDVKNTSLYYDDIMDKLYYKKEYYYDDI